MKDSILTAQVIEPYAQALMSLGQANDLTPQFGEEIANILDTLNESEALRQLITNPLAKAEVKKAVLEQIFGDRVHPFLRNFLALLVDRRRIMFLEGICRQYQVLLRKLNQAVLAQVTSAISLTDAQQNAIRDKVKAMTNAQQVDLETSLDPELLGGVIIRVGSQVIDASLRGQLRRISLQLTRTL